jgi:hypothetical protein
MVSCAWVARHWALSRRSVESQSAHFAGIIRFRGAMDALTAYARGIPAALACAALCNARRVATFASRPESLGESRSNTQRAGAEFLPGESPDSGRSATDRRVEGSCRELANRFRHWDS